jgi:ectoine hydroxylase-related dioxygenase (phytanoyl-CoA dioxygenase family)
MSAFGKSFFPQSRSITAEEISHFQKFGFVCLRNILTASQVDDLREAMAQALATFKSSPSSYDVTAAADAIWREETQIDDQGSEQHDLALLAQAIRAAKLNRLVDQSAPDIARGRFLLDTSVWRRVPLLEEFCTEGQLGPITAALLGVPAVRYYDDQLFVKEGGAVDRSAFHQDLSYFHLGGDTGCVFWIPLDKVRRGSGTMGYVPGSHRWGQTYKPNVFVSELAFPGSEGPDLPSVDANPDAYGVQYVEVDPGDVIVHHFLTIHGAEGNRSGRERRAFSLRYIDANLRYRQRPGAPAQPLHRQDMKEGELLDDTIHPVVWQANDTRAAQRKTG